ncbi:hypothetical protein [Hymenobacter cellulosivorans]|uniref:DUF4157 domain-containing protein n=1 Tax=Hymenobacter cellulosivorans TaxID=2932249 RepID=A0ABY4FD98_9BACT|nr:hypothetical protein [Hymenobacter cellulosivorans]UOQ54495.1 hypothetical protein MUN80_06960 [Hymenobacter cellulosivorans]
MELPHIVENSPWARIARLKLKAGSVAMVLGNSIHLSGATREQFLSDPYWVAHEMEHIRQFQEYGRLGFLWRYLRDWAKHGYYNIPFEVQAREAGERDAVLYAAGRPLPGPEQRHPTPKVK